jgi:hypothetical protein
MCSLLEGGAESIEVTATRMVKRTELHMIPQLIARLSKSVRAGVALCRCTRHPSLRLLTVEVL